MTKVFDGEVILPVAAGWVAIDLDVPFPYNNTDNLVIAVHEYTPGYESGIYFLGTDTDTQRSLVFYDDDLNPDPASPPTADFVHMGVANIRMHFGVDTRTDRVVASGAEGPRLTLWPNPATDKVFVLIDRDVSLVKNIEVLDISGRKVMIIAGRQTAMLDTGSITATAGALEGNAFFEIDITELPRGFYLIRISGTGWVSSVRLLKQ
jgi:hypothetical protein